MQGIPPWGYGKLPSYTRPRAIATRGRFYMGRYLHQGVRKRQTALASLILARDFNPISVRKVLQKKKARERKIPGFNGDGHIIELEAR